MSRSCPLPSPARSSPRTIAAGHSVGLAHDELCGARDLVGDGDLGRVQLVAGRVTSPSEIEERTESRHAQRDVGRSTAERSSEGVADDDADLDVRAARGSGRAGGGADASGSSGSRISVSGPFAFDWSTPAEAQTNPWRVSAMMSVGGLERTIRRLSWRITSMRRASSAPASSRARSEGTTSSRCEYATFDLRDRLLRDDDDVAAREPSGALPPIRRSAHRDRPPPRAPESRVAG